MSCFAGYRVFRVVLGFFGFVLGALLTSSVMGTDQTVWMIVAAAVGGIVGALILVAAYFVGVALIGAGVGALVVTSIWAALGREPHIVIVILFAIAGALAALALQRYVIITATSFGGAWTTIVGALALVGDKLAVEAARTQRRLAGLSDESGPGPALGDRGLARARAGGCYRAVERHRQGKEVDDLASHDDTTIRSIYMAAFSRTVTVDWAGSIMEGKGQAKAGSGAFTLPVTFPSRIGEPAGQTSPEELIAAAHASCFAMALNATVGRKGGAIANTPRDGYCHRRQERGRHQADDVEAEGGGGRPDRHREVAVRGGGEGGGREVPDLERAPRQPADRARGGSALRSLAVSLVCPWGTTFGTACDTTVHTKTMKRFGLAKRDKGSDLPVQQSAELNQLSGRVLSAASPTSCSGRKAHVTGDGPAARSGAPRPRPPADWA